MRSSCGAFLGLSLIALAACDDQARWSAERIGSTAQALSSANVRWQQRSVTTPPARMAHALVYDPVRQLTIAAGGRPPSDNGASLSDTWSWDGNSWSQLSVSFAPRGFILATFDSQRGVAVSYGGLDQTPMSNYFAETWERGTGSWSNRSTTPGARSTAPIAFDSNRQVSVLFGGFNGAWLSDLWEWDGTTWNHRCNSGPCGSAPHPARRAAAALAYDAARQETLLFGGFDSTSGDTYLSDTWTWDGSAWTQHTSSPAPSGRTSTACAYDPVTRRVYVFGGRSSTTELHDLWAWDGTSWELIDDSPPPGPRRDARLVWDTARRRGVLFGGRANSQSVDFWELSLVGNPCSGDDECHTGYCDGSVCADPPTGSNPDGGSAGASGGAQASGGAAGTGSSGGAGSTGSGVPSAGAAGASGNGASTGTAGTSSGLPGQGELDAGLGTAPDAPLDELRRAGSKSLYACSTGATPVGGSCAPWLDILGLLGCVFVRRASRR